MPRKAVKKAPVRQADCENTALPCGRLRTAARRAGYQNANQVARGIGTSPAAPTRWWDGLAEPSSDSYARLAKLFGVRDAWLRTGDGPMIESSETTRDDAMELMRDILAAVDSNPLAVARMKRLWTAVKLER